MENIVTELSVETIKQQLSPLECYQSEIGLEINRNHGWVDGGLCPFHNDKQPGSFYVNLDTGGFNCFSCGAKGGDVIAFLQLRDGVTFRESLRYLYERYGVG